MTTTRKFTATTTLIRRADSTALSILYDYTDSVGLTLRSATTLQSLIDQAIKQWWDGQTSFQKSVYDERELSFKISVSCPLIVPQALRK